MFPNIHINRFNNQLRTLISSGTFKHLKKILYPYLEHHQEYFPTQVSSLCQQSLPFFMMANLHVPTFRIELSSPLTISKK